MAAGAPRIFVSHLAGVPAFDPSGDQVGRVRDVVVMLRVGRRPPRVLGLVVELSTRRRIFLPMTRVTGVESGQVITTGVLNVRRFEQRPTERLVFGELLDRRVTLVETGEEVTVLDMSVQQLPARRDWEVDRVFLRKGRKTGAFRRARGETLTAEWSAVTGFSLEEHGQGAESLLATFEQLRPADLANVLHHLSPKRRGEVAAALDDDRLADVLEELPEDDQIEILGKLKEERAADVLEAMDPDDAADLLAELPAEDVERLLALMRPGDAADVRRLMAYAERTAGGLMTTEPIVLRPDALAFHRQFIAVVKLRHTTRRQHKCIRQLQTCDRRAFFAHETTVVVSAEQCHEDLGVGIEIVAGECLWNRIDWLAFTKGVANRIEQRKI